MQLHEEKVTYIQALQPKPNNGVAEFNRCNATGLRTALQHCDFGADLPHLSDSGHPEQTILPLLTRNARPNPTRNVSLSVSYSLQG